MTVSPQLLFASAHAGAYLSLRPLEATIGEEQIQYLTSGSAADLRAREGLASLPEMYLEPESDALDTLIHEYEIRGVVRGTSVLTDEPASSNPEVLVALAAERAGVPVIAIEDFPGNFRLEPNHRLDCLCVGEDSSIELHRSRGIDSGLILNAGNPRYGRLMDVNRKEICISVRHELGIAEGPVVLWAGQPDSGISYLTLGRILKFLGDTRLTLMVRAHPRDGAYINELFAEQLPNGPVRLLDVSDYDDPLDLCCASDLVATQFSSLAVEASYLGVPALFVLFDDLDKGLLRSISGFDALPWCKNECSFLIDDETEAAKVLKTALFDNSARTRIGDNFKRHFAFQKDSASIITSRIMELTQSYPQIAESFD